MGETGDGVKWLVRLKKGKDSTTRSIYFSRTVEQVPLNSNEGDMNEEEDELWKILSRTLFRTRVVTCQIRTSAILKPEFLLDLDLQTLSLHTSPALTSTLPYVFLLLVRNIATYETLEPQQVLQTVDVIFLAIHHLSVVGGLMLRIAQPHSEIPPISRNNESTKRPLTST